MRWLRRWRRKPVRVPRLMSPPLYFRTLNLRDEFQEKVFLMELKEMGCGA